MKDAVLEFARALNFDVVFKLDACAIFSAGFAIFVKLALQLLIRVVEYTI